MYYDITLHFQVTSLFDHIFVNQRMVQNTLENVAFVHDVYIQEVRVLSLL